MEQVMITRKPPYYMPKIPGELIFGISGNNYVVHYLPNIFGNLICNSFGAHSKSVKVRRGRREGDGTENIMTERPSHAHWFCP